MHRWGGQQAFPSVITVFSAPNYCGEYHNKGAVILIENEKMNIKQYKNVEHPFHLPNDIDLFQWSIPFLMEKVTDMLQSIAIKNKAITPISEKEINDIDFSELLTKEMTIQNQQVKTEKEKKMQVLRTKVKAFARMNRIFKTIKENQEEIIKIKEMTPDGKVPVGVLMGGSKEIHD